MINSQTNGIERSPGNPISGDVGEITGSAAPPAVPPIFRSSLQPWEQAVSLSSPSELPDFVITPVSRFLGPLLTVASPVWSSHAMARLRALQKKLIEHSLTLPQDDRLDCLGAVTMIEDAVLLRLRLEQMRMLEEHPENAPSSPLTAQRAS